MLSQSELIKLLEPSPKSCHNFHHVWDDLHIIPSDYEEGVRILMNYGNEMDINYLLSELNFRE